MEPRGSQSPYLQNFCTAQMSQKKYGTAARLSELPHTKVLWVMQTNAAWNWGKLACVMDMSLINLLQPLKVSPADHFIAHQIHCQCKAQPFSVKNTLGSSFLAPKLQYCHWENALCPLWFVVQSVIGILDNSYDLTENEYHCSPSLQSSFQKLKMWWRHMFNWSFCILKEWDKGPFLPNFSWPVASCIGRMATEATSWYGSIYFLTLGMHWGSTGAWKLNRIGSFSLEIFKIAFLVS